MDRMEDFHDSSRAFHSLAGWKSNSHAMAATRHRTDLLSGPYGGVVLDSETICHVPIVSPAESDSQAPVAP